ncbi:vimentin-like [Callorhinchus milii]|uniref:Intermediate filament protein n=1 Tax=Callorhinchus milii TaxID=7868 RepID=K4FSN1_CALMI|nr:vimentin-like [Callorhinchus milii]AFK11078.1 intermediate filament protein [Callorhinchus milii]
MFSRTSSPGSGTSGQDRCGGGADMTGENVERDFHEGIQEGKEQIKDLNDRFAKYINNTVMSLQRKNKELLGELKRVEREEFGAVEKVFQKDNQDFQCRMDELQNELVLFRLDLDKIKARLDKEIQQKREYEKDFQDLKKKYDDALVLLERLQCQCKLLEAQLAQLKIVRDQERIYWQQKIDNLQNLDQVDTNTLDLEQALRNMRSEYEQLAKRNKEELERYKQKFEESSNPLQRIKKETEAYRIALTDLRIRDELHKSQLQEKEREINRIKEYNKTLEKNVEVHATEYQTLLNVKNGLEHELSGYKSLLNQVEKKSRDYSSPPCITAAPKPAEDINKMWA